MTTNDSLSQLSDADLLNEVKRLAAIEREATSDLIRSLAEVEARKLHLAIGCSSMFGYCTQVLHLSEHAAYARIAAARAATRFPVVMDLLIEGAITLTTVTLLGRHLTDENHVAVLEAARHKSKSDVEMLVATLHPQSDVPSSVRKVPAPKLPAATAAVRARPISIHVMSPRTCGVPSANMTAIAARSSGVEGRCTETAGLQYHHRIPFADGGPTALDNLELRCPAHNASEAERWFGPLFVRERSDEWACPRNRQREGGLAWSGPSSTARGCRTAYVGAGDRAAPPSQSTNSQISG